MQNWFQTSLSNSSTCTATAWQGLLWLLGDREGGAGKAGGGERETAGKAEGGSERENVAK